jgi:uncharacterized damage-inducible protein DinB
MRPILLTLAILAVPPVEAAVRAPQAAAAATTVAIPKRGFRAEFLRDLEDVQSKIIDLASVTPADKYAWRPTRGVRSISEVYMHAAGGNYLLASFTGTKPPAYDTGNLEQITNKDRVVEELRKSFDFIRNAALKTSDADLDKSIKMFGRDTTIRGAFSTALNHLHEHLGQSIAYARMNGIVPPWSGRE